MSESLTSDEVAYHIGLALWQTKVHNDLLDAITDITYRAWANVGLTPSFDVRKQMSSDHFFLPRCEQSLLLEQLRQIPSLIEDLTIAITRQDRMSPRGPKMARGDDTQPLPFNEHASVAANYLHYQCATWARFTCEERGIDYTGTTDVVHKSPEGYIEYQGDTPDLPEGGPVTVRWTDSESARLAALAILAAASSTAQEATK
ncbi:hypothetical protein [Rhodococcus sp. 1168]|uniref:hypothetical protein n=1 Tax=Rhodococcus sp. 1168 TaxID=2018041 RepID=UPI000A09D7D4|nr:hypothetical protein [Rhodococcus sp. 1168]ORI13455.1 hypothetical protein BJI47_22695 [Rhodococcus sp. 1168]